MSEFGPTGRSPGKVGTASFEPGCVKTPRMNDPLGVAGDRMKRFVEGADRGQSTLFPECLDDWIEENNPVRVIEAFVDLLNLTELGFEGVEPAETGRPAYHPSAC